MVPKQQRDYVMIISKYRIDAYRLFPQGQRGDGPQGGVIGHQKSHRLPFIAPVTTGEPLPACRDKQGPVQPDSLGAVTHKKTLHSLTVSPLDEHRTVAPGQGHAGLSSIDL